MTGETLATNQEAESTVCHACGAPFVCGAMAGLQTCWCMEKPTGLLVVEAGASCYCPACLEKRISEQSSRAT